MNNSIQKRTTLYRYFDNSGQLLYVGITGDNTKRQSQHRRNSFWFGEIVNATFEHFPTREEALTAEAEAIRKEKPLHNVSRGTKIQHSDFVHMVWLAGDPENGHDKIHRDFAKTYQPFFMFANGNFPTHSQVVAFAMKSAKNMKPESKNLSECEICQQAFSSSWYKALLNEMMSV